MISSSGRRGRSAALFVFVAVLLVALAPPAAGKGGGSATSATNAFSPPGYVDYHELGGEPTTVVDRYAITSGTSGGRACSSSSPCNPDIPYVTNPLGVGFPGY